MTSFRDCRTNSFRRRLPPGPGGRFTRATCSTLPSRRSRLNTEPPPALSALTVHLLDQSGEHRLDHAPPRRAPHEHRERVEVVGVVNHDVEESSDSRRLAEVAHGFVEVAAVER